MAKNCGCSARNAMTDEEFNARGYLFCDSSECKYPAVVAERDQLRAEKADLEIELRDYKMAADAEANRVDELTAEKASLEQRVRELSADLQAVIRKKREMEAAVRQARAEMREAAQVEVQLWIDAYPEDIWVEPTKEQWAAAHDALVGLGMTLDKFSGAIGRRTAQKIIDAIRAIPDEPQKTEGQPVKESGDAK